MATDTTPNSANAARRVSNGQTWIDTRAAPSETTDAANRWHELQAAISRLPGRVGVASALDVCKLSVDLCPDEPDGVAFTTFFQLARSMFGHTGHVVDVDRGYFHWRFEVDSFSAAVGVVRAALMTVPLPLDIRTVDAPDGIDTPEQARERAVASGMDMADVQWGVSGWGYSLDACVAHLARDNGQTPDEVVAHVAASGTWRAHPVPVNGGEHTRSTNPTGAPNV